MLYAEFREPTAVDATFFGLQAAVLAVVVEAVIRIGDRALENAFTVAVAAGAFVAIFVFDVLFPIVIFAAALLGFIGYRAFPDAVSVTTGYDTDDESSSDAVIDDAIDATAVRPSTGRAIRVAAIWLALWFVPLAALAVALGSDHIFVQEGVFFSKVAVVAGRGPAARRACSALSSAARTPSSRTSPRRPSSPTAGSSPAR